LVEAALHLEPESVPVESDRTDRQIHSVLVEAVQGCCEAAIFLFVYPEYQPQFCAADIEQPLPRAFDAACRSFLLLSGMASGKAQRGELCDGQEDQNYGDRGRVFHLYLLALIRSSIESDSNLRTFLSCVSNDACPGAWNKQTIVRREEKGREKGRVGGRRVGGGRGVGRRG
jgi:hypothetical protein